MKYVRNGKKRYKSIRKKVSEKIKLYGLDITEEIGTQKIKEFFEVSIFRKSIKIIKVILMIIGIISGWMTIYSFFSPSDDSIALDNYQRGMNYLEDNHFEDAEKYFEIAYEKNSDLLQLIYYYAYTEFMLEDFEKSYKILEENKEKLDENELVILAMYEYKKENYEVSQKYFDKIQNPENLEIFAFYEYIDHSTKLAFKNDYNEGLDVFCNNLILLEGKINVAGMLPDNFLNSFLADGFEPEQEFLKKTIDRIINNTKNDKSIYVRAKLYAYFLLLYFSIQNDEIETPICFFEDMAKTFDYANYSDITKPLLMALYIYTTELKMYPEIPEGMKKAYKIVSKHYHNLESLEKDNTIKIEEEDRRLFETCEKISKEMDDNSFDPQNYNFGMITGNSDYKTQGNLLKAWCRTVEYMVDYKGQ